MRQEKRKKKAGENAKSKSQDCSVTFKPKLLKTRVNKGLVSFQKDDIEFLYPNWKVLTHIIKDLQNKKWEALHHF